MYPSTPLLVSVRLSRRTIDCGCVHLNVEHCVSIRQVRFDLAGVSNYQYNNPSLCCRTPHLAADVRNSIVDVVCGLVVQSDDVV